MKKVLISVLTIATCFTMSTLKAQDLSGHFYGEDALKFSQYSNYGSARTIGMGGAFSALGGDASNSFVNPAGLAFYNKSEFSISPVFRSLKTSSDYLGESIGRNSSDISIGQAAVVLSKKGVGTRKKRTTTAISYNSLVNFHNEFDYTGFNNRSSMMDYFAKQANFRGVDDEVLSQEFDTNTGYADTPTSMYYQAYLINLYEDGYGVGEPSFPVEQQGRITEEGNLGQLNLSHAVNFDDRSYLGGGIGLQTLNYNMTSRHSEFFENGEVFNGFAIQDDLIVRGVGLNLTLGGIYRLTENVRVGLNVTTPTLMGVSETIYSYVQIDQKPNTFETDFATVETLPGDFDYKITSPLRANIGASMILPQKLGVLSLEAEYIGYSKMGIKDKSDAAWSSDQKQAVQDYYKDVVNLKGGLELRYNMARLRAGINYLADPYKNTSGINRSKLLLSVGAGFRSSRFFADAAFSANTFDSSYTPYTLSNEEDFDSVKVNNKAGTLSVTVGTYF